MYSSLNRWRYTRNIITIRHFSPDVRRSAPKQKFPALSCEGTSAQWVLCGWYACRRVQRFVGLRLYKHVEIDGINGGVVTFWAPKSKCRSSFILRITYPQSSVTPPLAGPSGRRPPGMWRSPEPSPGSGGPPGLRATHAAWRRWWQPQKARLDHPGDVHFGLLKPISFIPWLWNGQVWPKGPYPSQTKKNKKSKWGINCPKLHASARTRHWAIP